MGLVTRQSTTPSTTLTLNFQSFSSIISFWSLNCNFLFVWYSIIDAFCLTSNKGAFKVFSSIWSTGDALGNLCKIKSNLPSKIINLKCSHMIWWVSYQFARLSFQQVWVWHSYFGDLYIDLYYLSWIFEYLHFLVLNWDQECIQPFK